MNKLNNSFKTFLDNVVKPLVKKEAGVNYRLEPVEGSFNSVKVTRSYSHTYYDSNVMEAIKIRDKNKVVLDTTLYNSSLNTMNYVNSLKMVKTIEDWPSNIYYSPDIVIPIDTTNYSVMFVASKKLYVVLNGKTVVNGYNLEGINLIKYLGDTGAGGYGYDTYNRLVFLGTSGDSSTYKLILINKVKLFSGNTEEIADAIENRYEYELDISKLGEDYADYINFEASTFNAGFMQTSYSHGILYITRMIGKKVPRSGSSWQSSYRDAYYVATIVDFARDRTENNNEYEETFTITERVLTELGKFGTNEAYEMYSLNTAKIIVSDNSSYYSGTPGLVSIFTGKKVYKSSFAKKPDNGSVITTEVPALIETNLESVLKNNVTAFAYCNRSTSGRNADQATVYLIMDIDGNLYKYDSKGNIRLYKSFEDMFKEQPELYSNGSKPNNLSQIDQNWYIYGSYVTTDFQVFYKLEQNMWQSTVVNGANFIHRGKWYQYNIDKLIYVKKVQNESLAYEFGFATSDYRLRNEFVKVYYTQKDLPRENALTMSVDIIKNNY